MVTMVTMGAVSANGAMTADEARVLSEMWTRQGRTLDGEMMMDF